MSKRNLVYGPLPKKEAEISDLELYKAAHGASLKMLDMKDRRIAELEAQVAAHPAALAAAKREALEAAADHFDSRPERQLLSSEVYSQLMDLVREVKP